MVGGKQKYAYYFHSIVLYVISHVLCFWGYFSPCALLRYLLCTAEYLPPGYM